ncbi:MAG: tetratricopeptide repeat protein [Betaproteobacteria bacterium]|nr:tetratricopeptide repeat protein [Betaproteobacteria bacterium]
MWKKISACLAVLLLAGCQTGYYKEITAGWDGINTRNYVKTEAEMEKIQALGKDLSNYDLSYVKYTLAVAKGHLCKTDEAGQLFKESIALETKVSGEYSLNMGKRYHEAGRMYYAAERYEEAAFYFSRWLEVVDRMYQYQEGLGPVNFSWALHLYADALEKSGKAQEAEKVRGREKRIIEMNRTSRGMDAYLENKDVIPPGVRVQFYPKSSDCGKENPVKE